MEILCRICGEKIFIMSEQDSDICECCFEDSFDGLDLEDKLEVLLK